uniref:Uncharacterized protein n=1 Tax=Magallana gigas TaxID=29159 RepID=K1P7W8_MAGGI
MCPSGLPPYPITYDHCLLRGSNSGRSVLVLLALLRQISVIKMVHASFTASEVANARTNY